MTHNFDFPKVSKMGSLRQSALKSIHSAIPKTNNYIKKIFVHSIKNPKPVIKRFKPIIRRIKRNCQTTSKKKAIKACLKMNY